MKAKLISFFVWVAIGVGVIFEWQYGIEWAGNLAMFSIWFFSIFMMISLFIKSEVLFKKNNRSLSTRIAYFSTLVISVMAGWLITVYFSLFAWVLFYLKHEIHIKQLKAK